MADPDGTTSGSTTLADLQKIAYNYGIDPTRLPQEERDQLLKILKIANSLGRDPNEISTLLDLSDAGFVTPSFLQKLLFGDGAGSTGTRLASDDPRYWDLQYKQLEAQLINSGLDAESARRQALTTLITNRNNMAVDVARTSADVAKTSAEFAANPRDTFAEAYYRNQVGGTTPFGDTSNASFDAYQKALADKASSIFQPVAADLNAARGYRDSIPQTEFYGPETRAQLNLPPTAAQELTGSTGAVQPAAVDATAPFDPMAALTAARAGAGSDEAFMEGLRKLAGAAGEKPSFAKGGQVNFGDIFNNRDKPGFSPSSSEGGTNLNIHERAVIVGESGQVYGTLGEKRPDGTVRAEQLIIKPLKSEMDKDKKLADGNKAVVESQKKTLASFVEGGSVTASPDDLMEQFTMLLQRLGGAHGGTSDPFGGTRQLVGAPANAIMDDPFLQGVTEAVYSRKGIRPEQLWADIAKFTPKSAQLVGQTMPRVNFLGV